MKNSYSKEYKRDWVKKFRSEKPLHNSWVAINSRRLKEGEKKISKKNYCHYIFWKLDRGAIPSILDRRPGNNNRAGKNTIDTFLKLKKQGKVKKSILKRKVKWI